MIDIAKTDSFPELTRTGRVSEELQKIINALVESSNTGDRFVLTGVKAGKEYNSMQQRIRAQAKRLDLKVIIRFDASEEKLYFKSTSNGSAKTTVKTEKVAKASK